MANTLNAGDKIHLSGYRFKKVDGKVKAAKRKIMIGEEKFDDTYAMCGINHTGDDLGWYLEVRKKWPNKVCKKCDKKLKKLVEAA